MSWPTACAARPTAWRERPNRWPSSNDTGQRGPRFRTRHACSTSAWHTSSAWQALTAPLGIAAESRTPAELRAWLRQREDVVLLLEKVNEARQALEPLEQAFQAHRIALIKAVDAVGDTTSQVGPGLADVLEHAEAVVKRHDDLSQRRAKLDSALVTAHAELTNAELSLQTAEAELTAWRNEWSPLMAKIGLEADATPEQAEVF